MRREARIGLLLSAFFVAAYLAMGYPLLASDPPTHSAIEEIMEPQPSQLNLRPPGSPQSALTPPATGQMVVPSESAPRLPRHIAFGVNDLGDQLRFHFNPSWAAEFRFLTGSASSDLGDVHALVFGMRGYRFFPEHHRLRFYGGLEGDYVHTSLGSGMNTTNPNSVGTLPGFGDTSGYALGGFGGVELRVLNRIAIDLDVGPYMIGLKEKVTGVSDTTLDFVGNTAINVYLF